MEVSTTPTGPWKSCDGYYLLRATRDPDFQELEPPSTTQAPAP